MSRRVIIKMIGLLLIGAMINVAVAWGLSRWPLGEMQSELSGFPSANDAWLRSIGLDPAGFDTVTVDEARSANEVHPFDLTDLDDVEVHATTNPSEEPPALQIRGAKKQWTGNIEYNDRQSNPLAARIMRTMGRETHSYHVG